MTGPTTPLSKDSGLGFIPLRSPLLWESRLISFPLPTKMFQFGRCRFSYPMYSDKDSERLISLGFPIRRPPGQRFIQLTEAFRRFTRPSSPVDTKASTSSPY